MKADLMVAHLVGAMAGMMELPKAAKTAVWMVVGTVASKGIS